MFLGGLNRLLLNPRNQDTPQSRVGGREGGGRNAGVRDRESKRELAREDWTDAVRVKRWANGRFGSTEMCNGVVSTAPGMPWVDRARRAPCHRSSKSARVSGLSGRHSPDQHQNSKKYIPNRLFVWPSKLFLEPS